MTHSQAEPKAALSALPRERLIDRAVEAIKHYIIAGGLQANDRLPSEGELAERLGVSRNVIRQALSALEMVGIVRTEHGRGTFVAEIGASSNVLQHLAFWLDIEHLDQQSYYETRLIFDSGVLQLAMQRATDEDLARLEEIVQAMERRQPGEVEPEHDAFHLALLEATGNRFLASLGIILYRFFWNLAANAPRVRRVHPDQMAATHRALLEGLRRRDPALIPQLVAVHLGAVDPLAGNL
jgi:DNA-binding FadR family transcriptional regulator